MRSFCTAVAVAVVGLAACGDDSNRNGHLADAPPGQIDAADATGDPGPPAATTLTVTHNGAPVPGVHTYFLNPDDTVVAMVDTDATGVATATMPLGGSVTALDPIPQLPRLRSAQPRVVQAGDHELRTFAGVKPGDHLVLTSNDSATQISFTLTVPPLTQPPANTYDVYTRCGNTQILTPEVGSASAIATQPTTQVTLSGCPAAADIVVVARQTNSNTPDHALGVLVHAGAALTNGGTVDLSADTYQAATTRTFSYPDAPDAQLITSHTLVSATGQFGPFTSDAGGNAISLDEPALVGATSIVDTRVRIGSQSEHHVVDAGALVAAYTLDLTGLLLPGFVQAPAYDTAAKRTTWGEDATGAVADLTITALRVTRSVNESQQRWHWVIAAPYAAGAVTYPTLPTDVADWTPSARTEDAIDVDGVLSAKVPGGYDAVRARALDLRAALDTSGNFSDLASTVTGRVVAVEFRAAVSVRHAARR